MYSVLQKYYKIKILLDTYLYLELSKHWAITNYFFEFGHFPSCTYVKCPYLSPNNCDPRGKNEKLNAKRTFDFLVKEYFKLIDFGRIFLVTQWSKRLQICFLLQFRPSAIGPSIFQIDPTIG